jgi:CRISPR/Cas system CSM-associated protein Csm2 small subunit
MILWLGQDTLNITEVGKLMGVSKTQANHLWEEVKANMHEKPEKQNLTPQQREFLILCLRLDAGNITEIGRLMGVKKTQAHRLWKEVKDRLRRCPELKELWREQ